MHRTSLLAGCCVLEPEDFSAGLATNQHAPEARPACLCLGEGKVSLSQALKGSLPELICSVVGGWGARGTGRKGVWFTEAECCQESFRPQMVTSVPLPFLVHTHPSGTLQMPTSTWEWVGRNMWPRGLRAVAPVRGGSLPEGMAHCNCQMKPEPQDKQSS